MSLTSRFVLLVICAGALGCEPLDTDSSLLASHLDGVVSQVALSADGLASSALVDESPQPPSQTTDKTEPEASEPVGGAAVPQGEEGLPALTEADGPSSDEDLGDLQEPPPTPAETARLAPELSSGEYGGGSLVVQQAAAVLAAPAAASPSGPEDSGASAAGETELQGEPIKTELPSVPTAGASSGSEQPETRADEFSPTLVGGEMLAAELSRVLPSGPSSDESALAALDALPRRSSSKSSEETQPCLPGGSGLLSLSLGQLSMVRAWLDGTLLRAELRGPDGRLYTVVRGDRIGADGGRVLQVSSTQVVVGEIGFGLDSHPFIVQEAIR